MPSIQKMCAVPFGGRISYTPGSRAFALRRRGLAASCSECFGRRWTFLEERRKAVKKFLRLLLMFITYPTRVADAVNNAETVEEFDRAF